MKLIYIIDEHVIESIHKLQDVASRYQTKARIENFKAYW